MFISVNLNIKEEYKEIIMQKKRKFFPIIIAIGMCFLGGGFNNFTQKLQLRSCPQNKLTH